MHTEGSWYYSNGYVRVHSKDQRKDGMILAATTSVETYEEQQANGRLMSAAPKMYRLLSAGVKFLKDCGDCSDKGYKLRCEFEELLALIDGEAEHE